MWNIVNYEDEKRDEMIEMTIEHYGLENDISNETFVEHQYFKNPEGNAYIKIAYDFEKERMAGQYMVIPRYFKVNGESVKSVLSLNTLTRGEYRGQGIFTKLADSVYEEAGNEGGKFCYGMPNQNSFPGFVKKLQFVHLGDIPLYLNILNPLTIFMNKLRIYRNKDNNQFSDRIEDRIIEINQDNVELLSSFFYEVRNKYTVMGIRDCKYFLWRYINIPRRKYKIFAYFDDDEVYAYAVTRITEVANMNCGMIVDFIYLRGKEKEAICLVKTILKYFKKSKVGLAGCLMLNHTDEANILRKGGFFICPKYLLPQPFPLIVRMFDRANEEVLDLNNWFFTMGDYDAV